MVNPIDSSQKHNKKTIGISHFFDGVGESPPSGPSSDSDGRRERKKDQDPSGPPGGTAVGPGPSGLARSVSCPSVGRVGRSGSVPSAGVRRSVRGYARIPFERGGGRAGDGGDGRKRQDGFRYRDATTALTLLGHGVD